MPISAAGLPGQLDFPVRRAKGRDWSSYEASASPSIIHLMIKVTRLDPTISASNSILSAFSSVHASFLELACPYLYVWYIRTSPITAR